MNTDFETESQKSPEAIEREIDAQRASIGNIVDALESKFTPGQVFDQALTLMQSNGSTFLSNLGTSVRNNPVPAVLTSVGLLWLMMGSNRPPSARTGYRVGPDQNRVGEWADGLADGLDGARHRLHDTTDSLKEGYQTIKDKATSLGDGLGSATDQLGHKLHDASDRLVQSSRVVGSQFSQMLKDQPLMVAAAGVALGAMIGAALPTTSTEQRYLGKTSADLTGKVRQQAKEGFEAVRDTVTKTSEHKTDGAARGAGAPADLSDLSRGSGTV